MELQHSVNTLNLPPFFGTSGPRERLKRTAVGLRDSSTNHLDPKTRELIALAVACTTQCPYCIEVHTKAAKAVGASREEIVESSFLAAALRAGGAATHGAMALKFYDKA